MYLNDALGVEVANELDPSRPLRLGLFELGDDATTEAVRLLAGGALEYDVSLVPREFSEPVYWSVEHRTEGQAEIFGFPTGSDIRLPTAIEVALVRAIAASEPSRHESILGGGLEISVGSLPACKRFREVIGERHPVVGTSLLFAGSTQAIIYENIDTLLNQVALKCLVSSFSTSPLKFRFLELYRVMEARFLADVRKRLFENFDSEPSAALREAQEALKAETNQIIGLAETQKHAFEACWTSLNQIRNVNSFVAALFRRVEKRRVHNTREWETGAVLIYQIRCAVVHSGEKNLIFESFSDGDAALGSVMPYVERAALLLVGIDLS